MTEKPASPLAPTAHIHAVGTAVPSLNVHSIFIGWAEDHRSDRRDRTLLARIAARSVPPRFGNMSSATLMFLLSDIMENRTGQGGIALALGPGLAAEGIAFRHLS